MGMSDCQLFDMRVYEYDTLHDDSRHLSHHSDDSLERMELPAKLLDYLITK